MKVVFTEPINGEARELVERIIVRGKFAVGCEVNALTGLNIKVSYWKPIGFWQWFKTVRYRIPTGAIVLRTTAAWDFTNRNLYTILVFTGKGITECVGTSYTKGPFKAGFYMFDKYPNEYVFAWTHGYNMLGIVAAVRSIYL